MHAELIKYHLKMKGLTVTDIARKLGVVESVVRHTITRTRTSARVRAAVAEAINKPESEVFPERHEQTA